VNPEPIFPNQQPPVGFPSGDTSGSAYVPAGAAGLGSLLWATAPGISLPVLVFLVFLALKLTGSIDWSWWWIAAPLWIAAGLFLAAFALIGILYGIFVSPEERGTESTN